MANEHNLRPVKTHQEAVERGRMGGKAKKGSKHISTHIQELLEDKDFTIDNWMNTGKKFDGVPIKAIITVAIYQALQGDKGWAEWLAKYGWGQDIKIQNTVENPILYILQQYTKDTEGVSDVPPVEGIESGTSEDTA